MHESSPSLESCHLDEKSHVQGRADVVDACEATGTVHYAHGHHSDSNDGREGEAEVSGGIQRLRQERLQANREGRVAQSVGR